MGRWVTGLEGGVQARCTGEARRRTVGNEKHSKFGESQTKAGEGERENRKQGRNRGRDVC